MKARLVVAVLVLSSLGFAAEQRTTPTTAAVTVLDENGTSSHQENQVLLLDSATGRVWLYSPPTMSIVPDAKKAVYVPALFNRVFVDGIDDPSSKPAVKTFDTVRK
jgi:hypothetical protein